MSKTNKIISLIGLACIIILIVWVNLLRYQVSKLRNQPIITDTITLIKTDTIKIVNPIPVYSVISVNDPLYIPVEKLVFVGDSLVLPKEIKTYQDSTYKAVVSGYEPKLEEIEVYQKTITNTITKTIKPQRWGVGIYGGYGASYSDKRINFTPQIGIGVYYNLYNLRK